MLGWFKKKFQKKNKEADSQVDQKIPVTPRDFGTEVKKTEAPVIPPVEQVQPVVEDTVKEIQPSFQKEEQVPEESPEPEELQAEEIKEKVPEKEVEQVPPEEASHETDIDLEEEKTIEPELIPEQATDQSEKIPVATVRTVVEKETEEQPKPSKPFFARLSEKLARTRENFTYQLDALVLGKKEIDNELLDDLEELLITADLGYATTEEILDHARRKVKRNELSDPTALKEVIKEKLKSFIMDHQEDAELVMPDEGPFIIMVVGVNGVGKTTTIGKVAHKFQKAGQSVLMVAADTFRAAAISQLKIWGERNNVPVLAQDEGSDPSSVVYDAMAHAKAKDYDVVLVDTAGRLHTQANLMEELKKIKRVMNKQLPGAPHEVMLVVDATTGQNGISQAKLFNDAVGLTGITLTKLDGTAKGGIVANIAKELKTPIRFIGVGEQLEDLRDFDPDEFIDALFKSQSASA